MRAKLLWLCAVIAWLGVSLGETRADWAELILNSQPGDFIGQGQTKEIFYTPANSSFFNASIVTSRDVAGQPAFLDFTMGTVTGSDATNTFSGLDFATDRLGVPITVGTYGLPGNTARRAAFAAAGHAGLDVSFQNRGSNTLTGNFTVNSVSFFLDAGNFRQLGHLDVNFEQHSEGATPALFGHFIYQSSAVPEPSCAGVICCGGLALIRKRRRY